MNYPNPIEKKMFLQLIQKRAEILYKHGLYYRCAIQASDHSAFESFSNLNRHLDRRMRSYFTTTYLKDMSYVEFWRDDPEVADVFLKEIPFTSYGELFSALLYPIEEEFNESAN